MRLTPSIVICLLSYSVAAAQPQKVLLRWKVPADQPMTFQCVQETMSQETSDSNKDFRRSSRECDLKDTCYFMLRRLPSDRLSAKLVSRPKGAQAADPTGLANAMTEMQKAFGPVQLRGVITPSGEITTFYMEQSQRNLLAILSELPRDSVAVGDTWSLHAELLWVKGAFLADTAIRVNTVRLVDLREHSGELIARLQYMLFYDVAGYIGRRSEKTHIGISYRYDAISEFNITEGRWLSYEGTMVNESKYPTCIRTRQRTVLGYISQAPMYVLDIE
jgi:hypothetical protein